MRKVSFSFTLDSVSVKQLEIKYSTFQPHHNTLFKYLLSIDISHARSFSKTFCINIPARKRLPTVHTLTLMNPHRMCHMCL